MVVVDANAVIAGVPLDRLGQSACTVPEVLREVRDSASRHRLQTLPFGIDTREPSEESIKAVARFARATGDLATLSAVDLRILALTHTLEVALHGAGHLRDSPPPPLVLSKKQQQAEELPGWGEQGGDWSILDSMPDPGDEPASQGSRIAAGVQALTLNSAEEQQAAGAGREPGGAGGHLDDDIQAEEESEEDEDEWEVAGKSHNAERRQRRKAARRAAWLEAQQQQQLASPPPQPATPIKATTAQLDSAAAEVPDTAAANGQRAASPGRQQQQQQEEGEGRQAGSCGGGGEEQAAGARGECSAGEDSDSDSDAPEAACGPTEEGAFESSVCCITADFAMQNVLLQMGLRLVAPNGLRVTQLSRWVLRCTACAAVSREVGRVFCPRCGNSTLERVRVVVGQNGTETYGVRKKHVLRGTIFSLPKPRGGRASKNPVLSEDVLMQRTQRLRRSLKKKEKVDPFAPEYGPDSWFKLTATNTTPATQQQALAQAAGMTALLANWKSNPNERRGAHRTNRRK